jgi:hypothetical protein
MKKKLLLLYASVFLYTHTIFAPPRKTLTPSQTSSTFKALKPAGQKQATTRTQLQSALDLLQQANTYSEKLLDYLQRMPGIIVAPPAAQTENPVLDLLEQAQALSEQLLTQVQSTQDTLPDFPDDDDDDDDETDSEDAAQRSPVALPAAPAVTPGATIAPGAGARAATQSPTTAPAQIDSQAPESRAQIILNGLHDIDQLQEYSTKSYLRNINQLLANRSQLQSTTVQSLEQLQIILESHLEQIQRDTISASNQDTSHDLPDDNQDTRHVHFNDTPEIHTFDPSAPVTPTATPRPPMNRPVHQVVDDYTPANLPRPRRTIPDTPIDHSGDDGDIWTGRDGSDDFGPFEEAPVNPTRPIQPEGAFADTAATPTPAAPVQTDTNTPERRAQIVIRHLQSAAIESYDQTSTNTYINAINTILQNRSQLQSTTVQSLEQLKTRLQGHLEQIQSDANPASTPAALPTGQAEQTASSQAAATGGQNVTDASTEDMAAWFATTDQNNSPATNTFANPPATTSTLRAPLDSTGLTIERSSVQPAPEAPQAQPRSASTSAATTPGASAAIQSPGTLPTPGLMLEGAHPRLDEEQNRGLAGITENPGTALPQSNISTKSALAIRPVDTLTVPALQAAAQAFHVPIDQLSALAQAIQTFGLDLSALPTLDARKLTNLYRTKIRETHPDSRQRTITDQATATAQAADLNSAYESLRNLFNEASVTIRNIIQALQFAAQQSQSATAGTQRSITNGQTGLMLEDKPAASTPEAPQPTEIAQSRWPIQPASEIAQPRWAQSAASDAGAATPSTTDGEKEDTELEDTAQMILQATRDDDELGTYSDAALNRRLQSIQDLLRQAPKLKDQTVYDLMTAEEDVEKIIEMKKHPALPEDDDSDDEDDDSDDEDDKDAFERTVKRLTGRISPSQVSGGAAASGGGAATSVANGENDNAILNLKQRIQTNYQELQDPSISESERNDLEAEIHKAQQRLRDLGVNEDEIPKAPIEVESSTNWHSWLWGQPSK